MDEQDVQDKNGKIQFILCFDFKVGDKAIRYLGGWPRSPNGFPIH